MNWKKIRNGLFGFIAVLMFTIVFWGIPLFIIDTEHIRPLYYEKVLPVEFQKVSVTAKDGVELSGLWLPSDSAKATIIFLHGIRSRKEYVTWYAYQIQQQGYNVLLPDLRAHGESGGTFCTFGAKEKEDISAWIDQLQLSEHLPVGVWGHSLGGAVALLALEHDKRLDFGIAESTFTDFHTIVGDYFERMVGSRPQWFIDFLVWRAGGIANFDPDEASPNQASKDITQPVLFVHGTADQKITSSYCEKNFHNCRSKSKEMVLIPNANHVNVWHVGGEAYQQQAFTFIEQTL